ncbi:glycosyltransferase [Piscinibacter sakaiensis]|uniref:glycosyltransferase n=1 Tax=Piscinibacter sakaiensis TaxID=1547922 RepID=UPI003AADAFF2
MIRVAFLPDDWSAEWTTGRDGLRDLLRAILSLPERRIEPVLFVAPDAPDPMPAGLAPIETVRTPLLDASSSWWRLARSLPQRLLGHDKLLEGLLREHRIDVLSHAELAGGADTLPTIGWIPDFQHRRVPQFFSTAEIAARNEACKRIAGQSRIVLLNSRDALHDFARQCPDALAKGRVLHPVVAASDDAAADVDEAELRQRLDLRQPFFHLPNPFWAHKNHRIVLEALALLKQQGRPALVVCTDDGENGNEPRQPEHLAGLIRYADKLGVADRFRVPGGLPRGQRRALMRHALAVINPSTFDGWSVAVEAAKSLGLSVILSDTPVHREQAPDRAHWFDPESAAQLATAMAGVCDAWSAADEREQRRRARQQMPQRLRAFGADYQAIVLDLV